MSIETALIASAIAHHVERLSRRLPKEVRPRLALAFAPDSGGCWLGGAPDTRVLGSPLPIAAAGVCSPSLSVGGVVALSLPKAAVLSTLLVPVLLLRAAVVVGQALGVLLMPARDAGLAVRSAAVLARAIAAEPRSRLLLPALRAALQVIRAGRERTICPSPPGGTYCAVPRTSACRRGCCTNARRGGWIVSKVGLRHRPSHPSREVCASRVRPGPAALTATSAIEQHVFWDGFVQQPPSEAIVARQAALFPLLPRCGSAARSRRSRSERFRRCPLR
jgi:hypothetical protein